MRKILVVATLLLPLLAFAEDLRVASHYLNSPDKYDGQKITVTCGYVTRDSSRNHEASDTVTFHAYTVSKTTFLDSASIDVRVPSDYAEKFVRKYGTSPRWDNGGGMSCRPLTGIFKKASPSCYIEYTPSS